MHHDHTGYRRRVGGPPGDLAQEEQPQHSAAENAREHPPSIQSTLGADQGQRGPGAQRAEDERQRRALRAAGYRVVTIRYDRDLEAQLREHEDIWGEATA